VAMLNTIGGGDRRVGDQGSAVGPVSLFAVHEHRAAGGGPQP